MVKSPEFVDVAEGSRHSLGVTTDGDLYSWGKSASLGQLGRDTTGGTTTSGSKKHTGRVPLPTPAVGAVQQVYASIGSSSDSGHSAFIDQYGRLWMSGCDRWQQLGLGSSNGGATGYTWIQGRIWHERFTLSNHVNELMGRIDGPGCSIRDVALGGDHTLVLSSKGSVYAFGKGGDGQLGLNAGKPFVSAPVKSPILSHPDARAVCAIDACSITLIGQDGHEQRMAGRCRSPAVIDGLTKCINTKRKKGLLTDENQ